MDLEMMTADDEVAAVVDAAKRIGDPVTFVSPPGYQGVALCILDSIWSIGVRYSTVENVVARYRSRGASVETDGPAELLAVFAEVGGAEGFAERIGNYQRTSTRNGVLKSEAVQCGCWIAESRLSLKFVIFPMNSSRPPRALGCRSKVSEAASHGNTS